MTREETEKGRSFEKQDQRQAYLDIMGRYIFVGGRSPQGREQETNGPGSTGAAFGMENTVRLKNMYSGNSFIFILPCLKKSRGSVMAVSQVGYSVLRERCLWEVLVQRTGQVGTQQLAHSVLWWRQVHYPAGPPPPTPGGCVWGAHRVQAHPR